MYYLLFVTPNLGLIKNYVKYKILDIHKYIRSYLLYAYIFGILKLFSNNNVIYRVIIYERWIMFLFKIFRDIINDTYNKNKQKYILKYKLEYTDE
jgi:hypothetical protein